MKIIRCGTFYPRARHILATGEPSCFFSIDERSEDDQSFKNWQKFDVL